jgi:hypothetical protein
MKRLSDYVSRLESFQYFYPGHSFVLWHYFSKLVKNRMPTDVVPLSSEQTPLKAMTLCSRKVFDGFRWLKKIKSSALLPSTISAQQRIGSSTLSIFELYYRLDQIMVGILF